MTGTKPQHWLIPVCFAIIYLVWGSTYLANWYAIQDIPPFLMSGSRFFMAGLLLYGVSFLFGAGRPTAEQWKNTAFIGTLLLAVGTGSMVWSEQFINSGMVALMAAFQPLLIVLMMWQMYGKRPSQRTIAGTALGMIGMAFLVGQDQFISDKQSLIGIAVIFVAIMAWGFTTIKVAKLAMPSSKLQGAAMQMLIGGPVLLVVPEFSETPGNKGLTFQHRTDGDVIHLVFISYWEDMKAIRKFAGKDYRKARLRNADKINLHFKLPLLPLFITLKTVIIST
jgi:drug/metabolite transporter (DMT)-like permease